jgi:hypothetical protein
MDIVVDDNDEWTIPEFPGVGSKKNLREGGGERSGMLLHQRNVGC